MPSKKFRAEVPVGLHQLIGVDMHDRAAAAIIGFQIQLAGAWLEAIAQPKGEIDNSVGNLGGSHGHRRHPDMLAHSKYAAAIPDEAGARLLPDTRSNLPQHRAGGC